MGTQITQKITHICNYILIGSASSCIFLTLSLRLVPSIVGLLLVLLHATTIAGAAASSTAAPARWWVPAIHLSVAVLQGVVAVLVFSTTGEFLAAVGSYVREEDGVVMLRMCGGLGLLVFCLELVGVWVGLLGWFDVDDESLNEKSDSGKIEELKNWPCQVQV